MADNYTPIPASSAATTAVLNAPLEELDAAIGNVATLTTTATNLAAAINELDVEIGGAGGQAAAIAALQSVVVVNTADITVLEVEVAAARGGYGSVDARLDMLTAAGGNVATLTNGAANAGQKSVTVDSTVGFIDTAYVAYALVGGAIEYNQIDSITPTTTIVLTTNIGTGGIADDTYFAMISSAEYARLAAIDYTDAVFVDSAGSDTNGAKGRPDRAFATIDAALDALGAGGGAVYIGIGTFAPVTTAKIVANTKFFGSGKPLNVSNARLDYGTVIQGPLKYKKDGIELHNLGIDSGPTVCTALYGGTAQEGIAISELPSGTPLALSYGNVISNVAAMCKDATCLFHAAQLEGLSGATVSNLETYYGIHGIAIKAVYSTFTNLRSWGSTNDNVIIKSDGYHRCHDVVVSGLTMGPLAGGDAGGLIISSNLTGESIQNIVVTGAVANGTAYGVQFEHTDGSFGTISIDIEMINTVSGTVNLNGLFLTDTVQINGAPTQVIPVGTSGYPAFVNSWASFEAPNGVAAFYKANGRVYLSGAVGGGAVGSIIFTLPTGYRPIGIERIAVASQLITDVANIAINSAGEVSYEQGPAAAWIALSGSFFVGY